MTKTKNTVDPNNLSTSYPKQPVIYDPSKSDNSQDDSLSNLKPSNTNPQRTPISIPPKSYNSKVTFPTINGSRTIGYFIILAFGTLLTVKTFMMIFEVDPITGVYGFIATFMVFNSFFFSYVKYKDPSIQKPASIIDVYSPRLTIIIPSKNDEFLIRGSVDACLESTYQKFKIILVDDGSTDDTGAVMDSLKRENPDKIDVIHFLQNQGKRKAIVSALRSRDPGDLVVLIDSDSIIEKTALERLVNCFRDPDVGAVTAHGRALNPDVNILTKIQDTWYDSSFFVLKGVESYFNSVTCCSGILSVYRKEAIWPCLDLWVNDKFLGVEFRPGDDRHLTAYVMGGNKHYIDKNEKKWKVVYCESAHVKTEVPTKFKVWANQQIRWKKSWVRVFLFMAPFFYKDRPILPVITYYLSMSLSLIAPIISFRALVFMPLNGNWEFGLLYLTGLLFIGMMFAFSFKVRNPDAKNRWLYRVFMTPLQISMSWLLYYAVLTIKKSSWLTR